MAELLKIKTKLETDPRLMTKEERWQWFLREKLNGGVIPRPEPASACLRRQPQALPRSPSA
jgi:hypothetical protein